MALAFAREGADVSIAYLDEVQDAADTCRRGRGSRSSRHEIKGDAGQPSHYDAAVECRPNGGAIING